MSGVITALKVQTKNKDRVNVYIDGRFAFGLAAIEAARLRRGQQLSDDDVASLQGRDEAHKAHENALRFLDYRPRSVQEIRSHLKGKGFTPDVIDGVVERLADVGLLDDRAFAHYWLENRTDFRPRGERALRQELRQKGVPDDIIAEVLSESHSEDEAGHRAAVAQMRKVRAANPRELLRKVEAHLVRRGFSYDVAREAASSAWRELHKEGDLDESEV
jgi:regulatory protein